MSNYLAETEVNAQCEANKESDLSQDSVFLTNLLNWNDGYLKTMLESVVNLDPVKDFLKVEVNHLQEYHNSNDKKESPN